MCENNKIPDINEFSIFNNIDKPCRDCLSNLIKCHTCNGYFEINKFIQHDTKCNNMYIRYKEIENVIDCKFCNNFIKISDLEKHKQVCESNPDNHMNIQCRYCNKYINALLIDEHLKECEKIESEISDLNITINCNFCDKSIQLHSIESHEVLCQQLIESKKKLKEKLSVLDIKPTKEWDEDILRIEENDENLCVVLLKNDGEQFKFILDLMKKSIPTINIKNVFRIQNKYLWDKYEREKQKVIYEKNQAEEKWLFHGSRSNQPKSLYRCGFDISFASDRGSCGRGIYFARQASYSCMRYFYSNSNNSYFVFLAKVITGIPYVINMRNGELNKFKKPPFWDDSKFIYYDSVTDTINPDDDHIDQMYVIYENNKAYPFYLIEFDYIDNQMIRLAPNNVKPNIRKKI